MKPAAIKTQVSAGGVIYRNTDDGIEVALVAVKGGAVWSLPKGIMDKKETPKETALREVKEETGLDGRLIDKIGEVSYWYFMKEENMRCKKTVHYYLMEFTGGNTEEHDFEVDECSWFSIDEAVKKAAYKGDKEILKKAEGMIKGGLKPDG